MEKFKRFVDRMLIFAGYTCLFVSSYIYLFEGDPIHATYFAAAGCMYFQISKL